MGDPTGSRGRGGPAVSSGDARVPLVVQDEARAAHFKLIHYRDSTRHECGPEPAPEPPRERPRLQWDRIPQFSVRRDFGGVGSGLSLLPDGHNKVVPPIPSGLRRHAQGNCLFPRTLRAAQPPLQPTADCRSSKDSRRSAQGHSLVRSVIPISTNSTRVGCLPMIQVIQLLAACYGAGRLRLAAAEAGVIEEDRPWRAGARSALSTSDRCR